MRLHELSLSAFGPFPGTETVDFDALGADRLFLLHGETGAGKTSLLDAVAFALYGKVPGARGEVARLRSDHATVDVRTEVELELTVGGERLRVTRRPEQSRPKARGTGTTRDKARTTLARQRPDGQWEEVAASHAEVADYLQARIGLTAEQFFQVVLLPQGEFARFLRAEPEERAALLDRLFGASRYRAVEDWLAQRRRDVREQLGNTEQEFARIMARAAQVAGLSTADTPVSSDPGWLEELVVGADEAVRSSRQAAVEAGEALTAVEAADREARGLADRQRRLATARNAREQVELRRTEIDAGRERLAAARRAAPVRSLLEQLARARAAERAAAGQADRLRAAFLGLVPGAPTGPVELRSWSAVRRAELGRLDDLVAEEQQLAGDDATLLTLGVGLAERDAEIAQLTRRFEELPARRDEIVAKVAAADHLAADLRAADEAVAEIAEVLDAARKLETARTGLAALEDAERAAIDEHQRAREHLLGVRELRLTGMAAELAAGLRKNTPCPVCGSRSHPVPAPLTLDTMDDSAEQEAQYDVDLAEAGRARTSAALAEARATIAGLAGITAGRGVEKLLVLIAEARARAAAARQAEAALPALRAERDRLEQERVDIEARLTAARTTRAGLSEQLAAATAATADRRLRVEAARGDAESVAARRDRVLTEVAAGDAYALAAATATERATMLADAEQAALEETALAGFPDQEAAAAAVLEPRDLAELERAVVGFDADDARSQALLDAPDLVGLPTEPAPVELTGARLAEARAAREAAVTAQAAARRTHEQLAALAADLAAAVERAGPLRAAYAEIAALADLVAGGGANRLRMRLQSFVLAARLEQVAEAANERLSRMSAGRYTFEHSDALARRGARSGLGLDVVDAHSGATRPTKTLSGGESFLASLALALGLADVVTAEAGATTLDSLFVDEGFGSLDPATLDVVMDTLDELRAGGRVVGLISHVAELKTRIPTRLQIRGGPRGSTVES